MTSLFLPLLTFAIASTCTPGPNNIMLAASGANFGFWRTLPHMLGIIVGFPSMIVAVGFGLGQVFNAYPLVHEILKAVGSAYMLFLAWKIASAGKLENAGNAPQPLTFIQAALFQWVNPKAWIMVVAALTTYTSTGGNYIAEMLFVAAVFFAVSFLSTSSWCLFGALIGRWLTSPRALRVFNITMGGLIVVSIALLYT